MEAVGCLRLIHGHHRPVHSYAERRLLEPAFRGVRCRLRPFAGGQVRAHWPAGGAADLERRGVAARAGPDHACRLPAGALSTAGGTWRGGAGRHRPSRGARRARSFRLHRRDAGVAGGTAGDQILCAQSSPGGDHADGRGWPALGGRAAESHASTPRFIATCPWRRGCCRCRAAMPRKASAATVSTASRFSSVLAELQHRTGGPHSVPG